MRVVDLTQPLSPATTPWPGDDALAVVELAAVERDGFYARRLDLHEHTGTHFDAPAHFVAGGATVDEIAAGRLVAAVRIVDVSVFAVRFDDVLRLLPATQLVDEHP